MWVKLILATKLRFCERSLSWTDLEQSRFGPFILWSSAQFCIGDFPFCVTVCLAFTICASILFCPIAFVFSSASSIPHIDQTAKWQREKKTISNNLLICDNAIDRKTHTDQKLVYIRKIVAVVANLSRNFNFVVCCCCCCYWCCCSWLFFSLVVWHLFCIDFVFSFHPFGCTRYTHVQTKT